MADRDWARLAAKLPDAYMLRHDESNRMVSTAIRHRRDMPHSELARLRGPMLRKLLDPLLLSAATSLLLIDSDILFFQSPEELLMLAGDSQHPNTFNRDHGPSNYSLTPAEAAVQFGVTPVAYLNAGLALLNRASVRLDRVDAYLASPDVLKSSFFAEQTVHALHGGEFGCHLLPDTYLCSTRPGLTTSDHHPIVAKHYVETPRPLLFDEGMPTLIARGKVP